MGMWSEDKKHGKGTSTDSCGAKVVGFWREGDLIYKTSFTPKGVLLFVCCCFGWLVVDLFLTC